METYLELKTQNGISADYSSIDNETILRNYGIEIPPEALNGSDSMCEQPNGQDQAGNPSQDIKEK